MPLERSSRRFGVEFEFTSPIPWTEVQHSFRQIMMNAGIPPWLVATTRYAASGSRLWHLKTDRSCGFELATPALTFEYWPLTPYVLQGMQQEPIRAGVDYRCGLHVHHDLYDYRSADLAKLCRLWAAVEPLTWGYIGPERQFSQYCGANNPSQSTPWRYIMEELAGTRTIRRQARSLGRHCAMNLLSYWQRGTVEFRGHRGTLDGSTARWWVLFTQALVDLAKSPIRSRTLERLYEISDLEAREEALVSVLRRRSPHETVVEMLDSVTSRKRIFQNFATGV